MTKYVRIENADMTAHKVDVEVWQKNVTGGSVLVSTTPLDDPTALAQFMIHSMQYLIVKERD